ncbi:hypothetical protein K435DRAFT_580352, partial [Dendrothele bispora CBS 962.96]
VFTLAAAAAIYASPLYTKQPYHISVLMLRIEWVQELLTGHLQHIKTELGVCLHVFLALVAHLRLVCGLEDSRGITLEEKVAIFLY